MRYSSVLLSAATLLTTTYAIPAEAPWAVDSQPATTTHQGLKDHVDAAIENHAAAGVASANPTTPGSSMVGGTSPTSMVGTPATTGSVPPTSKSGSTTIITTSTVSPSSKVGSTTIITTTTTPPSSKPTTPPTTTTMSPTSKVGTPITTGPSIPANGAYTTCTTFHLETPPYQPITSCTTYLNGVKQGPTTMTTSTRPPTTSAPVNNGAITSCTTYHMETPPYNPVTSCTTINKQNDVVKPAGPTTTSVAPPPPPPANGAKVNQYCTSLYGNFTWCYPSTDTKADPNRFPACNDVGCVLPAVYQAQIYKPSTSSVIPATTTKDYAPWATGPTWTTKVFSAQANVIVATYWTTEWLQTLEPLYKNQANYLNQTGSQFQSQSFFKINLDDNDTVTKLKDVSVRRLPTYVFYRAGAEIARLEGFQTQQALADKMKSLTK